MNEIPNKLKQVYLAQVRNTLFFYLNQHLHMSVYDIGDLFSVDKSTVSRGIKKGEGVDKKLLKDITKFFK